MEVKGTVATTKGSMAKTTTYYTNFLLFSLNVPKSQGSRRKSFLMNDVCEVRNLDSTCVKKTWRCGSMLQV